MSESNKNFAVFGATGGIGKEVCRRLAGRGHRVLLAARDRQKLQALATELDMPYSIVDCTESEQVEAAFSTAADTFDRIDGAVNCVGSLFLKPAHMTSDGDWSRVLRTNLDSAFYVLRSAAKRMMREGGSIILISSAAARVGLSNHEAIGAAKAGINGLTLAAAASYARSNIRVNAIAPGLVETPLAEPVLSNPVMQQASQNMHALGRFGKPGSIASVIEWLLEAEQDWITGQIFSIDGGLSTVQPRPRASK